MVWLFSVSRISVLLLALMDARSLLMKAGVTILNFDLVGFYERCDVLRSARLLMPPFEEFMNISSASISGSLEAVNLLMLKAGIVVISDDDTGEPKLGFSFLTMLLFLLTLLLSNLLLKSN